MELRPEIASFYEQGREAERLSEARTGLLCAEIGDARHLSQPDRSVDVVLLMGPLYHLLEVRVASNAQQLCWDFETASPPVVGERMHLGVASATPGLDFITADGPSAQDGSSAIPGQAGSSGRWTSLLVNAADLDPALHAFPGHYSFVANAEWNNTQLGTKHAYGEDTVHGTYP